MKNEKEIYNVNVFVCYAENLITLYISFLCFMMYNKISYRLYFTTAVPFDQVVRNDDLGCGEIWIFYVVDDLGGSFTSKLTGSDVN